MCPACCPVYTLEALADAESRNTDEDAEVMQGRAAGCGQYREEIAWINAKSARMIEAG